MCDCYDYWLVKLNSKGKIQWDKTIGGNKRDGGYFSYETDNVMVTELSKNRYVVAGSSESNVTGDKKRKSRGGADYWIVGLAYIKSSLRVEETSENISGITAPTLNKNKGFTVYPNPAKNTVTVNYTAQKNGQYLFELTDLSGKILLRKQTSALQGGNHTTIDVSRFAKGAYFITLILPDKTKESLQLSKE